jgi:hypothetical protein
MIYEAEEYIERQRWKLKIEIHGNNSLSIEQKEEIYRVFPK